MFQIISVNQGLDAFLDDPGLWLEKRELGQHRDHELLVQKGHLRFHETDNGGLDCNILLCDNSMDATGMQIFLMLHVSLALGEKESVDVILLPVGDLVMDLFLSQERECMMGLRLCHS